MVKKVVILIISFLLIVPAVWAGGWNNTLMGARAMAIGGAFTGIADDPSAIFHNPGGLGFQENRLNFSLQGFYVWPTHEYTMPTGATIRSKYDNPLPQFFVTYRTSEKITLGFGIYIPYAGGGVDWKKDQLGVPLESVLGIYALTPTIAYQFSDKLSLGFNLIYYRGICRVNTEMGGYGVLDSEETGGSLSAGLGLMYKPTDKLSLGLSIRGPTEMKLSGTTSMYYESIKMNLDSETRFSLPWDMEVGLSYKITDNFLFATGFQYTMWSTLDKVEKTIRNVPGFNSILQIPVVGDVEEEEILNFKDILIWRTGVEYVFPQGVALRAGIGLDHYASPEETLSITNIDVNKFTLLGGIGYRAGKMQIDFFYAYAMGSEREKTSTDFGMPLIEKYNLNVFILGLGITLSY
jgi:long-chain fatty acid transport protein